MLEIETKLSILFYPQIDSQTKNKLKIEQYLWFFINYRQKYQLEQLAIAKFAINNRIHLLTKVSLFITNYRRELRMRADIRKKEKVKKITEFAERIKKI